MNTSILHVFLVILLSIQLISGNRRKPTDSILDIINTDYVKRTIAERRLNTSSRDEKRFIVTKNDLDDDGDVVDTEPPDVYQTSEMDIDANYRQQQQQQPNRPIDLRFNDTINMLSQQTIDAEALADLQMYQPDKLLKSSKNALFVTRKEYLKKDWCKTEPLIQHIREEGCLRKSIMNRFCYGQCNSFYIPKSPKRTRSNRLKRLWTPGSDLEPEDLTGPAFRSCAFCKPKKFTWMTVTLKCPSLTPQFRRKKVQRIKQCKCVAEPLN